MTDKDYTIVTNKTILRAMTSLGGEIVAGEEYGISVEDHKQIMLLIFTALDNIFNLLNGAIKEEVPVEEPSTLFRLTLENQIVFTSENNIRYGQDFRFHKGIPQNIPFTASHFPDNEEKYILTGEGYGKRNKYGNGSIYPYGVIPEEVMQAFRKIANETS